jgi:glutathione S-transferase
MEFGQKVGRARRRYRVPWPVMYAEESENKDARVFNCVQRGHQNCLEFLPQFFVVLLLGGLQYPRVAAALGAAHAVARLQYFRGYSTGNADARFYGGGKFHFLALLGLLLCAIAFTLHQFFPALD